MLDLKSKSAYRQNLGSIGVLSGGLRGGLKTVKMLKICSKLVFLNTPKILPSNHIGPKCCLWAVFDSNSTIYYFETI